MAQAAFNEMDDRVHPLQFVRKHGMRLEREIELDRVFKQNDDVRTGPRSFFQNIALRLRGAPTVPRLTGTVKH